MLSMSKEKLKSIARRKFSYWISKRMPACDRQVLSQKNIFILPSKFGVAYIVFTILIFILGTNYQNNLILLLSYLLSSLFITAMLYCFLNMSGLIISAKGKYYTFCDERVAIPINIFSDKKRYNFGFKFNGNNVAVSELSAQQQVEIPILFKERGLKELPRLRVSTEFPLGLFHCWTNLKYDVQVIVGPKPVTCRFPVDNYGGYNEQEEHSKAVDSRSTTGSFYELRPYKKGESLKQVAWKQLAKTGSWMVSQHHRELSDVTFLSLEDMPSSQLENKLQYLCYLVIEYHYANKEFGLVLGADKILPELGQEHFNSCLLALATYAK